MLSGGLPGTLFTGAEECCVDGKKNNPRTRENVTLQESKPKSFTLKAPPGKYSSGNPRAKEPPPPRPLLLLKLRPLLLLWLLLLQLSLQLLPQLLLLRLLLLLLLCILVSC